MNRTLYIALLAAVAAGPAAASFYVDDDAPVQTAAVAKPTNSTTAFDVPFYNKRSWIGPAARRKLGEQLARVRAAEDMTIVASSAAPNTLQLAQQRADAIKQWFMDNDVPASKIVATADAEPRPKELADVVTVTLTVRNSPPVAAVPQIRAAAALLARPVPTHTVMAISQPQPIINDQTKLVLMERIVAMVRNKITKPEEGFNLMAEVLTMQDPSAPAPGPAFIAAPAPLVSPMVATLIAADVPRQWTLDSSRTLRQNLEDWAHVANWEVSSWQVANQYQVSQATLTGTFYDALAKLAEAVPNLDFSVNKTRRTLRVSDAAR